MLDEREPSKPKIAVRIITLLAILMVLPCLFMDWSTAGIVSAGVAFVGAEMSRGQRFTNKVE